MEMTFIKGIEGKTRDHYVNVTDFGSYIIEVVRFNWERAMPFTNGPLAWCVYVILKPENPLHKQFDDTRNEFAPECNKLPWHVECTYFERLKDGSVKLGCDFSHWCDRNSHGYDEKVNDLHETIGRLKAFMQATELLVD